MEIPVGRSDVPIAVIGMACRLPGADNLEQFWQLLASGGSAVVELPHERLDQELYYDPKQRPAGERRTRSWARSSPAGNSTVRPAPFPRNWNAASTTPTC